MTAEEFLKELQFEYEETGEYKMYFAIDIPNKLREFAKIKVTEALKTASEQARTMTNNESTSIIVDKDSILNAYPLDLIK